MPVKQSPLVRAQDHASSAQLVIAEFTKRRFLVFLVAHVIVWTLFATIALSSGSVHHDMTEAWSWGKEFQFGYYKHPPFYAWVTALWFHVFPRQDWCFYLLSAVNAGVGLVGVWMLAGRFLQGPARFVAILLLALGPFYNFLAINFNANAILLAVWPWTAYFFVRSMETRRLAYGVFFGALAAIAILSKYFSLLLLASCFASSLLHPNIRRYYLSWAPYCAVGVCALLIAPHVWWAVGHGLQTVGYASSKLDFPRDVVLQKLGLAVLNSLAFWCLPMLAMLIAFRSQTFGILRRGCSGLATRNHVWIGVLAFGPFVLTLLSGLLFNAKISSNFMIPVFFMAPIAIFAAAGATITTARLAVFTRFMAGLMSISLLVSPIVAYISFIDQADRVMEPRRELAEEATRLWHAAYGTPLPIVAGTSAYGHSISFYSADAPSHFILNTETPAPSMQLRHDYSPWITPARIAREGLLIGCLADDVGCIAAARAISTIKTRHLALTLARSFLGRPGRAFAFELFMIPPARPLRDHP